jgi:GTP cyclohydrolase II
LNASLAAIAARGWGVVLYLRQEGRGIGLQAKIQAYNLQDKGLDTVEANRILGHPDDARDYQIASTMLGALGVNEVCLLSNNPDKVTQLAAYGITVVDRLPLVVGVGEENRDYLTTKVERMGHLIEMDESD